MQTAPRATDPVVLSYLALRKAGGVVALALPFMLAIPWWFVSDHTLASSISSYYYTGMRNLCGWIIIASIALLVLLDVILKIRSLRGLGTVFCLETTSLLAFGVAWLVKGETFLKDTVPQHSRTVTTDGHTMVVQPGQD